MLYNDTYISKPSLESIAMATRLIMLARDCCVMLTPVCKYCLNVSEERENVQIHVLTSHCYTCLFAKLWF